MVKKISAIVLALVLCLSVVVLPVSAAGFGDGYSLPDGAQIAFKVELDKEYYSAGDTATVSIYVVADESLEFGAGAIAVGFNTAVFNTTDNTAATIKASATSTELYGTYYKTANQSSWGLLTGTTNTQIKKIIANNTAEENTLYDAYAKITVGRNMSGTHENAASNKNGIYGSEISSTSEPLITFKLKVAADVADGTAINVGITSGSVSSAAGQTYFKVFSDPGNATTAVNTDETTTDMSSLVTTATVGEATPDLTIVKDKTQINFDVDGNKLYEGTFAIRQFVEFDNLLDVFGTLAEAKDGADGTGLTEVGFVYATTDSYNKTDALAVIDAGASSGAYTLDNDAYISTTSKANSFVMGYTVKNIADKSVSLTILAYAKYVVNGEEAIATIEIAGDYSDIYSTYESKIPPVNPEA